MESAVVESKVPLVVYGEGEVDHRVERGHGSFSKRQVQEKIVGDCPHAFVRHNNPDHCNVTYHGHDNYTTVGKGPKDDSPDWLHELVPIFGPVIGGVGAVGPRFHIGEIE